MGFFFFHLVVPIIKIVYAICVVLLSFVGLQNLIVDIIYLLKKREGHVTVSPENPTHWPCVTVQLPIYNERFLAERIIKAVTDFDYPADKLEIQVLDDSTDFTTDILIELVEKYRDNGVNIKYLHRVGREGYKAGNLAFGMQVADGEFLAIFDADFIPGRDWLKKTVPWFQDEKVGFVQTRWEHINFWHNLVTRMAGLTLDGHFVVEQFSRSRAGLFMGFNGSAGIWRKACIEEVGGWQWDTMTEDVDMTFRSQLGGWKGIYLPDVTAPAELPENMDDFKLQQYRWCRGTAQVSLKLMNKVLHTRLKFKVKAMAMLHLLSFLSFPMLIVLFLMVLPVCIWGGNFITLFWWGTITSIGPMLLFSLARTERCPRLIDRLKILPFLLLIGVGISLVCGLSVVSGAAKKGGVFLRTARVDPRIGREVDQRKKRILNLFIIGEMAMCAYLYTTVWALWSGDGPALAPWLLSTGTAFFFVAIYSLIQRTEKRRRSDN